MRQEIKAQLYLVSAKGKTEIRRVDDVDVGDHRSGYGVAFLTISEQQEVTRTIVYREEYPFARFAFRDDIKDVNTKMSIPGILFTKTFNKEDVLGYFLAFKDPKTELTLVENLGDWLFTPETPSDPGRVIGTLYVVGGRHMSHHSDIVDIGRDTSGKHTDAIYLKKVLQVKDGRDFTPIERPLYPQAIGSLRRVPDGDEVEKRLVGITFVSEDDNLKSYYYTPNTKEDMSNFLELIGDWAVPIPEELPEPVEHFDASTGTMVSEPEIMGKTHKHLFGKELEAVLDKIGSEDIANLDKVYVGGKVHGLEDIGIYKDTFELVFSTGEKVTFEYDDVLVASKLNVRFIAVRGNYENVITIVFMQDAETPLSRIVDYIEKESLGG